MRVVATLMAVVSAACLVGGGWLWLETWHVFHGAGYAPHAANQPGYRVGDVEADGTGIFLPSALLLLVGLFLGRWAWNLWRAPRGTSAQRRE